MTVKSRDHTSLYPACARIVQRKYISAGIYFVGSECRDFQSMKRVILLEEIYADRAMPMIRDKAVLPF